MPFPTISGLGPFCTRTLLQLPVFLWTLSISIQIAVIIMAGKNKPRAPFSIYGTSSSSYLRHGLRLRHWSCSYTGAPLLNHQNYCKPTWYGSSLGRRNTHFIAPVLFFSTLYSSLQIYCLHCSSIQYFRSIAHLNRAAACTSDSL